VSLSAENQRLGAVAACRFGLGARPGEIAEAAHDPRGWLVAQLAPAAAPAFLGLAGSADRLIAVRAADPLDTAGAGQVLSATLARNEVFARAHHAATTPHGFRERWAMFWTNHFALQGGGGGAEMLSGAFVREAIDPHHLGVFDELLLAAERHPAMMIALNQSDSVGPRSKVGLATKRGINENLARELMELHSVGVDGGYGQRDVTELALALAGWTVGDPGGAPEHRGRFVDDLDRREPGPRQWFSRTWPESDGRAEAMLRELARKPQTRARLAFKVARHFVADAPPVSLVARLSDAMARSGGSLHALATALVDAPEAWAPTRAKFKTPYEHLISSYRAVGSAPDEPQALLDRLSGMGHVPLWAASAKGADDVEQAWATPLALAQRADFARSLATRSPFAHPQDLATSSLGATLGPDTRRVLASNTLELQDAFALALLSPEFQSR